MITEYFYIDYAIYGTASIYSHRYIETWPRSFMLYDVLYCHYRTEYDRDNKLISRFTGFERLRDNIFYLLIEQLRDKKYYPD